MIQSSTSPCFTTMSGMPEAGIEGRGGLAFDGQVKSGGAVGIVGIEKCFREIKFADANRSDIPQPGLQWAGEVARAMTRVLNAVREHLLRR